MTHWNLALPLHPCYSANQPALCGIKRWLGFSSILFTSAKPFFLRLKSWAVISATSWRSTAVALFSPANPVLSLIWMCGGHAWQCNSKYENTCSGLFWCFLRVWFGSDLVNYGIGVPYKIFWLSVRDDCALASLWASIEHVFPALMFMDSHPPSGVSCLRSCGFFCLTLGKFCLLPWTRSFQALWLADASSSSWMGGQIVYLVASVWYRIWSRHYVGRNRVVPMWSERQSYSACEVYLWSKFWHNITKLEG